MSSRNVYLSPEQRIIATTLYKSLRAGAEAIRKGMADVRAVQSAMAAVIEQEPALMVDYLVVCDPLTLEPLSSVASRAVLLGAVRLGSVRLIDNLVAAAPRS
jgi:pantoate--beta-alanine ligase